MILVRQEKIAILILVTVVLFILVSAGILERVGKDPVSRPYGPDSMEGELVRHQGTVDEVTMTATGGHQVLVVSGVRVFVPASMVRKGWPSPGEWVSLYGTVQTYRGQREILITSRADIATVTPGVPEGCPSSFFGQS